MTEALFCSRQFFGDRSRAISARVSVAFAKRLSGKSSDAIQTLVMAGKLPKRELTKDWKSLASIFVSDCNARVLAFKPASLIGRLLVSNLGLAFVVNFASRLARFGFSAISGYQSRRATFGCSQ